MPPFADHVPSAVVALLVKPKKFIVNGTGGVIGTAPSSSDDAVIRTNLVRVFMVLLSWMEGPPGRVFPACARAYPAPATSRKDPDAAVEHAAAGHAVDRALRQRLAQLVQSAPGDLHVLQPQRGQLPQRCDVADGAVVDRRRK